MNQERPSWIRSVKIDDEKIELVTIGTILRNLESSPNRVSEEKLKKNLEKSLRDEGMPLNTHHLDVVYDLYLGKLIREENIGYLVINGRYFIVNRF